MNFHKRNKIMSEHNVLMFLTLLSIAAGLGVVYVLLVWQR